MILLETNVRPAVMQTDPPEAVLDWLDDQPPRSVWTTTVTVFEVEYGWQRPPEGRRRDELRRAFRETIAEELGGRVLPLDAEAALAAGTIASTLASEGRSPDMRDAQIAGIARARAATLATRNPKHFEGLRRIVSPWEGD